MNLRETDAKRLSSCIKVAACICGKDGIISQQEEQEIFRFATEKCEKLKNEDIELALIEFFDSDEQIEDYLGLVDEDLREFTLTLAEASASADGLNIMENLALQKAYQFWGIEKDV